MAEDVVSGAQRDDVCLYGLEAEDDVGLYQFEASDVGLYQSEASDVCSHQLEASHIGFHRLETPDFL